VVKGLFYTLLQIGWKIWSTLLKLYTFQFIFYTQHIFLRFTYLLFSLGFWIVLEFLCICTRNVSVNEERMTNSWQLGLAYVDVLSFGYLYFDYEFIMFLCIFWGSSFLDSKDLFLLWCYRGESCECIVGFESFEPLDSTVTFFLECLFWNRC
jgi:hypothetical protein